jgi:hypothetical protein
MSARLAVVFIVAVSTILFASEPAKTTDMAPVMCKKGKLIFEDAFTKGEISKAWNKYKGNWQPDGDTIKVQEVAADAHHPAMSHNVGAKDVIVQAKFKFDGAKWMGLSLDNKEHVARCIITPTGFKVVKMSGIGGTTKGVDVDERKFKFETGKWYTMLWEVRGSEMIARIDDLTFCFGDGPGVETEKLRFELISGGEWAGWDDVKVWEAEENPDWKMTKAKLQSLKPAPKAKK